jgi:hypothetical protein
MSLENRGEALLAEAARIPWCGEAPEERERDLRVDA